MGLASPESVFFASQSLDGLRQRLKMFPKTRVRSASHGKSSSLPERISSRTSLTTERSFPLSAKSASICLSQAASSRCRMKAANSANSPGDNVSTAFFISERLTATNYAIRRPIQSLQSQTPGDNRSSKPLDQGVQNGLLGSVLRIDNVGIILAGANGAC